MHNKCMGLYGNLSYISSIKNYSGPLKHENEVVSCSIANDSRWRRHYMDGEGSGGTCYSRCFPETRLTCSPHFGETTAITGGSRTATIHVCLNIESVCVVRRCSKNNFLWCRWHSSLNLKYRLHHKSIKFLSTHLPICWWSWFFSRERRLLSQVGSRTFRC